MKAYLCPFPGCLLTVEAQGRYCPRHAHLQPAKDAAQAQAATKRWEAHHARNEYSRLYNTARWRTLRREHLARYPNCVRCGEPGNTVDHIIPHRGDEALAYDTGNLQTLCARCHAGKSRGDRG